MRGHGDLVSSIPRRSPDDELLQLVARLFADAGLAGAIIGGMARNHWAIPRLTFDLDITVIADARAEEAVLAAMEAAGFAILREQDRQSPSGPSFVQAYNSATHQIVEFQAAKTPYQQLLLERALPMPGAEPLRVATREDMVVLKLIAFRDKDRDDLRELSRVGGLDWAYIEHWADEWQVTDRLKQVREWRSAPDANTGPP
jgi:Nucleotidyltransferase of unknown function (DUF6036)